MDKSVAVRISFESLNIYIYTAECVEYLRQIWDECLQSVG